MRRSSLFVCLLALTSTAFLNAQDKPATSSGAGFVSLNPDSNLSGWHGEATDSQEKIAKATDEQRAKWAEETTKHWRVEEGVIINDGVGPYLTTDKKYGDFELKIEYSIAKNCDSGIYLRGVPQVQIWDPDNLEQRKHGNELGSGGLWNNSPGAAGKDPLVRADKPIGEWNAFRIIMVGDYVSIWLNDKQIVNHARMENYWNRAQPIARTGPIQLQTHGGITKWRNVQIREIGSEEANEILTHANREGFQAIFDGKSLTGWKGATDDYEVVDGAIRCKAGKGGQLYTENVYRDFEVQLQIKIPQGCNNGLAIRYPGKGDPAYSGMCELQVLDNEAAKYAKLDPRQYHGSAYGMAPAARGYLRPAGEWNFQKVTVKGSKIQVELNGSRILDTDLSKITEYMANSPHPGKDFTEGHFGFAGHNDPVEFKDVMLREIK